MINIFGLIAALIVLTVLCVKSINLYLVTIIASAIAVLFNGMPLGQTMLEVYAPGFAGFISTYFFRYLWGTFFGVLMEKSGAALSVADGIIRLFGKKYCFIALPLAVAALAYSGVAGTVSIFVILPIFKRVFKEADLPKRFIPGLFFFGSGTFINCAPGSAQNLNVIATRSVGLEPSAGVTVGLVGSVTVFILGILWTFIAFSQAAKQDEHYMDADEKAEAKTGQAVQGPPVWLALLPMCVVVFCINFRLNGEKICTVESAVFFGCLMILLCLFRYFNWKGFAGVIDSSAAKTMAMLGATSAMTGFGSVIMATPAYTACTDMAMNLNLSPLVLLAISMSIICACTASATSAVSIVGPTLGKTFVDMGLHPEAVARVMAISATGFDSVPQNGTIVMTMNVLCNEKYKDAYPYLFVMNVIIPLIGTAAVIFACGIVYG